MSIDPADIAELRALIRRIDNPGPGHYERADNGATMALLARIIEELERLGGPQEPKQPDSRAKQWRCRFRIYDARDMDEPVADTDEELTADRPGAAVIAGLPAVAFEVAALTKAFHAPAVVLLTEEDLAKGLRGIRPTIHRNGGHGRWSLPYKTDDAGAVRSWLMRVDIVKETVS